MRRKSSIDMAVRALSDALSGAALRAKIGLVELGEVVAAKIGDDSDAGISVDNDKRDVWVKFTDVLSGLSGVGRLFAPAGILWRAPAKGDGAVAVSGRKMRVPGGPVVMADGGDGSTKNVVPSWFPDDAGLYEPTKKLHVEAKNDEVRATGKTAVVEATDGDTDLTGTKVNINGSDYWLLKTDTFLTDLSQFLTTLIAVLQAGTQGSPAAQQLTALSGSLATLNQFITNLSGATYKSTKAKNG